MKREGGESGRGRTTYFKISKLPSIAAIDVGLHMPLTPILMCISESNKNLIAKSAENERKVKKRGKRKKGEQGERERNEERQRDREV